MSLVFLSPLALFIFTQSLDPLPMDITVPLEEYLVYSQRKDPKTLEKMRRLFEVNSSVPAFSPQRPTYIQIGNHKLFKIEIFALKLTRAGEIEIKLRAYYGSLVGGLEENADELPSVLAPAPKPIELTRSFDYFGRNRRTPFYRRKVLPQDLLRIFRSLNAQIARQCFPKISDLKRPRE